MSSSTITRRAPDPERTSSGLGSSPSGAGVDLRYWAVALLLCTVWFEVLRRMPAPSNELPAWLVPVTGLASQLLYTACEALVAVGLWRALGSSVRWSALVPRLIVASSPDLLAMSIAVGESRPPHAIALWLAGIRADGPGAITSGVAFAFAGAGLLTSLRLLLSARLQAGAARASFPRALLIVGGMWLASRLLMWWSYDLLQGRSFRP